MNEYINKNSSEYSSTDESSRALEELNHRHKIEMRELFVQFVHEHLWPLLDTSDSEANIERQKKWTAYCAETVMRHHEEELALKSELSAHNEEVCDE